NPGAFAAQEAVPVRYRGIVLARTANDIPRRGQLQIDGTTERNEDLHRLAEGIPGAGMVEDARTRLPVVQHTHDAIEVRVQADLATHAVVAAKELPVELAVDHDHGGTLVAVRHTPAAAITKWHIEQREEVA